MNLYGIWIDHAQAFIVKASPQDIVSIEHIPSGVEPNHHPGEIGEHVTVANQNKPSEQRKQEMHHFCKGLLIHLRDADEILIFGPSSAKFDLKNYLEKEKSFASKLKDVLTTDKMTEAQMRDFVKKHLQIPR